MPGQNILDVFPRGTPFPRIGTQLLLRLFLRKEQQPLDVAAWNVRPVQVLNDLLQDAFLRSDNGRQGQDEKFLRAQAYVVA